MSQFFTLLTKTGQGLLANAIAYGEPLTIAELAIGDGGGTLPTPDATVTRLVNEVRRGPINQTAVDDDNPNWTIVEQVLPPDVGGWTIREVGLYDTDGNLIAYGNYPETYKPQLSEGSARTQTIRFVMEVTDTSAVTLRIDPSVVMASRQYVDDKMAAHEKSRNHPAATTTAQGFVQFATKQEHLEGTRDDRAAKPAGVAAMIEDRIADQNTVDAGGNDSKFVTPKTLRWGISFAAGTNGYVALPSWLGGFIFQWMRGTSAPQSGNDNKGYANRLPIPFPTALYIANSIHYGSQANVTQILVRDTTTLNQIGVSHPGENFAANVSAFIFAIGR